MNEKKRFYFTVLILAIALIIGVPGKTITVFADNGEEEVLEDTGEEVAVEEEPAAPEPTYEEKVKAEAEQKKNSLQQQMDDINKQLKNLEEEQLKIKGNINSAKGEVANKQAVVNELGYQISNTYTEIGLLDQKIGLLEQDISEKEEAITEKQKEYDENYEVFLGRVRAMSMHDDASSIGLILGTDDFVGFLTANDTLNRIAEHDKELMEKLDAERVVLEGEMEELEGSKSDLESTRVVSQTKRQELSSQQAVAESEVQDVLSLQKQFEKEYDESKAKSAAMQAEINRIYEQIKMSENPYVGGQMTWPVPGFYNISSYYGWRFGGSDFHTGMDISGGGGSILGKPVVAANDGVVAYTNWSHSPGRGYGIYIILDHGGNTSTLYAHLSNISVSNGQEVKRGQTIGAVGSTGWSTGPHLHFEVRQNGQHVNPQPYVTG